MTESPYTIQQQLGVLMIWTLGVLGGAWFLFERYVSGLEHIIRDCPKCRARAGLKKNKDTPSSQPPTDKTGPGQS